MHEELDLVADDFSSRLTTPAFKAVLRKHRDNLALLFNFYSGADHSMQVKVRDGVRVRVRVRVTLTLTQTPTLTLTLTLTPDRTGKRREWHDEHQ